MLLSAESQLPRAHPWNVVLKQLPLAAESVIACLEASGYVSVADGIGTHGEKLDLTLQKQLGNVAHS